MQLQSADHMQIVSNHDINSIVVLSHCRRPWLYPSWIFRLTKLGQQFANNCNYVHKLADEIIAKRKDTLVGHEAAIFSMLLCWEINPTLCQET